MDGRRRWWFLMGCTLVMGEASEGEMGGELS